MEALNTNAPAGISHFILGIDPVAFYPLEDFLTHVDNYINYIKNSPTAKCIEEIFTPGNCI